MMCDTTYPIISDDQALTDCLSPSFSVWEDLSFSQFSDYEDLGNTLPDIHLDDDFLSFDRKEETVFDSQPSSPLPSSPQVKVESSCSSPAPVLPQTQSVENKLFVEYQKTIEEQNAQLELHRQLMHQYRKQVQQLQFQQQWQQQHYQCLMQNQRQQMQQMQNKMQLQVTATAPSNFYPSPVQNFTSNTGSVVVSTPPATPPSPISHWNYSIVRPSAMISTTPLSSPSMSPSYSSPSYASPSPSPAVDSANGMQMTNLNTAYFGSVPQSRFGTIPMDISGNLTDSDYKKIFRKYHKVLLLDSHPQMTEQDLEDIQENGRMYFLRNVKTIVPKIGPWKFHAHISRRRSDERQYNIPGRPITCKVKEWLTDDGLWRLYHYKRGKNPKK